MVRRPAQRRRAPVECQRMEQLQRIRRGSGLPCGVLRELPCGLAEHHAHRRQGKRGRRRYGNLYRQNLFCHLYGSGIDRRSHVREQAGLVHRQRFPAGKADRGMRVEKRVHEQQFQRKFVLVLVACGRLRVEVVQRPQRRFLRRVVQPQRGQRRRGRAPAL